MGVGADDHLAGGDQALFRQERVLHAHLPHVEEVRDGKALGKFPGLGAQLRRLDILAGGGVVQNNGDLIPVEYLGQAGLLKLRDGHRGGDIVSEDQVQLPLDELSRLHGVQPGAAGQNFLRHGHSHKNVLPPVV